MKTLLSEVAGSSSGTKLLHLEEEEEEEGGRRRRRRRRKIISPSHGPSIYSKHADDSGSNNPSAAVDSLESMI